MPVVKLPTGEVREVTQDEYDVLVGGNLATGETRAQSIQNARDIDVQRQYDNFGDEAIGFGQGLVEGASLGLVQFDDVEDRRREEANPYVGLAGNVVGAVAPAILSGGTSLLARGAAYTPAGLAARAGVGAAGRLGVTGVKGAALASAVEGAFQGAGNAVGHAIVSDDPLTVEGFLADVGVGALIGGGAGFVGAGIAKGATNLGRRMAAQADEAARAAAAADQADAFGAALKDSKQVYDNLKTVVGEASVADVTAAKGALKLSLDEAKGAARGAVKTATEASERVKQAETAIKQFDREMVQSITNSADAYAKRLTDISRFQYGAKAVDDMDSFAGKVADTNTSQVELGALARDQATKIKALVAKGDYAGASAAVEKMRVQTLSAFESARPRVTEETFNLAWADMPPEGYHIRDLTELDDLRMAQSTAQQEYAAAQEAAKTARVTVDEVGNTKIESPEKAKLPGSLEALRDARVSTLDRVDEIIAKGGPAADEINGALQEIASRLGVTLEGASPIKALQAHLKAAGDIPKAAQGSAAAAKRTGKGGILEWLNVKGGIRSGAGRVGDRFAGGGFKGGVARQMASAAVGHFMAGPIGAAAAVAEVSGARAATVNGIRRAVAKIGPKVGRTIRSMGPGMAALAVRLDGTPDDEKDPTKRLANRIDEVARAALMADDTAFTAVQPIIASNPDAAARMQAQAVKVAQYLQSVAPKDPGNVQSQLKSTWRPTREQEQKFASQYLAATRPLVAMEHLLAGNLNQTMADTLLTVWPALHQEMATQFVMRLPEMGKLAHSQLAAYTAMLRVPMHGLQTSENIAWFQGPDLHGRTPPAQPKQPTTPTFGGSGGPKPASSSPSPSSLTQVQRLTQ